MPHVNTLVKRHFSPGCYMIDRRDRAGVERHIVFHAIGSDAKAGRRARVTPAAYGDDRRRVAGASPIEMQAISRHD